MVTVASATLWITQQLDAWVPAVQAAALLYSLVRRTRPHPWQRSAIALNLGMLGVVGATVGVALRGEPSTIALAHFASLTQGLQLLDARPRRTEFLLVALALFQVVLAANLTDSVFFTPLLVAFVFATVWTLLVHTLHSEAVEAGHVRELSRAITPGLVRTTILASGLSVLLAGVLFLTPPRLRSSVVTGSLLGPALATAGFSDTVAFGALGRIRQDSTVVLRVETLEGREPDLFSSYWRGLAFDTFDGTSWSVQPPDRTRVPGSAEMGVTLGRERGGTSRIQRIVREPVEGSVVFAFGDVRALQGSIRRLELDSSRGLYAAGQADERVRYTIETRQREWRDEELRRDRAIAPRGQRERYTQHRPLPEPLASLARAITSDAETDADRARAIESHLLTHGRYSDTPPPPDPDSEMTPVERFLVGDMAGHCEYFASAMVLLARELEIPSRLVNGFAGGRQNAIGGFVELTRSDAHAWVEVHYDAAGWVRYDPTPPDLRVRPVVAPSFSASLRELGSALELWWFQRVVGFDRSDQIAALRGAWLAWKGEDGSGGSLRSRRSRAGFAMDDSRPWREGAIVATCGLLLVVTITWLLRRLWGEDALPSAYASALRELARRGLVRGPSTTARDFAAEAGTALPPGAAAAFSSLTEAYLAARFGGREPGRSRADLVALRSGLRATGARRRGRASPRLPRSTPESERPPRPRQRGRGGASATRPSG
jgi:transglutaminase-like putative cysteine protease